MLPLADLLHMLLHATVALPLELRAHYLLILQEAYLSTAHVCNDVVQSDDFPTLLLMLTHEVENFVTEVLHPPHGQPRLDGVAR